MKNTKKSTSEAAGKKAIIIVLAVTLAVCFLTIFALNYGYQRYDRHLQFNVEKQLQLKIDSYGNYLSIVIKERFRILENLEAFCQNKVSQPDFEKNFQNYSAGLTAGLAGIKFIALAPKGEISLVYPILGYEDLFGERLHPPNFNPESLVENQGNIIIEIPSQLINGEKVLNAYIPIYIKGKYWGLATIQMNIPRLLYEAGLNKRIPGIDYTVRTSDGFILRGQKQVFNSSPVSYAIPISGRYWELAAIPVNGWYSAKSRALISYQIISFLLLLLLTGLTAIFTLHYVSLKQAVAITSADLSKSESRYRYLFDNISLPTFLIDDKGCFVDTNQQASSKYQYSKHEFNKMKVADLSPDSLKKKVSQKLKNGRKGTAIFNWRHVRKDGTEMPVEIRSHPIEIDGKIYLLDSVRDLTEIEKAQATQKMLQQELHQAQKMEAIGQLAGGIAHDFNNQLSGILGYADLLKKKLEGDKKLSKYAEKILLGVQRSTDLTSQLLTFSRKGKNLAVEVDIHSIIEEVIGILSHSIDKRIRFEKSLKASPCITKGDPSQLQNVVLNLAINARDAMPEGGKLIFKTDIVELDEAYCKNYPQDINQGEYIHIVIEDTGIGMDENTKARMFEPFYTTKAPGSGTGMGLAAVYGTIKNHQGAITVETELKKGTKINLYFHLLRQQETKEEIPDIPAEPKETNKDETDKSQQILLVDDEQSILDLAKEMLVMTGYKLITCSNGKEALRIYKQHWQTIDLVILDMVMPEMTGKDTFLAMKEINPDIKAMIASGYNKEGDTRIALDSGAKGFIPKPFSQSELAEAVEKALQA